MNVCVELSSRYTQTTNNVRMANPNTSFERVLKALLTTSNLNRWPIDSSHPLKAQPDLSKAAYQLQTMLEWPTQTCRRLVAALGGSKSVGCVELARLYTSSTGRGFR